MVTSTSQLAAAGDRISRTAEQLPNLLGSEREKLLAALKTEKQGLMELSRQVSQTLGEGSRMADSTQKALKTYSDLITQIEKQPKDPHSEPFRIKDYAETALEINRMSQRLIDLLRALQPTLDPANFEKLTAQVDALTQQTQTRSQAVVDYAFQRAILLVAASCLLLLATALLYQFLNARLFRSSSRQRGPDRPGHRLHSG
jgi:DNA repair exonuclease SbcCD ATPase subunit